MDSLLQTEEDESRSTSRLVRQAVSFVLNSAVALGAWLALMLLGYAVNPDAVPQTLILVLSLAIPLLVGFIITRIRQDDMATAVWLLGLIWFMVVALWIVDMPTRPNECYHCNVTDKLTRTFFSIPEPSGLIDDDGPFLGTWPAAALIGYSIGAALAMKRKKLED
jgi:hypothetical protein